MTVADHIRRYPRARTSTIAHLVERDRVHEQLRREVAARNGKAGLLARIKRLLRLGRA